MAGAADSGRWPVLQVAMAVAVAAALLLWWNPAGSGGVALPVPGFALAPIFPVLVTLTPTRLGAEKATGVIGLQPAAAAAGGALIPAAGGVLAEAYELEVLAPFLAGVATVMVVVVVVVVFAVLERLAPARA